MSAFSSQSRYSLSPLSLCLGIRTHMALLRQLIRRDVVQRYRGTALGMLWPFMQPLLMLSVYTFVFTVVFKARWQQPVGDTGGGGSVLFALTLYAGLLVHQWFAECLNRSPAIILQHTGFVKKIVFPLEILPMVVIGSGGVHLLIGLGLLTVALTFSGGLAWSTCWLLPLVLFPFACLLAGLCWGLAALGVYVRDIGQLTGLLATVCLFLGPIFYPLSSLPETIQPLLLLNPLTYPVEAVRDVLMWGELPGMRGTLLYTAVSLMTLWAGYAFFQLTRRGFADVL